jgi:hypothetical protein
MWSHLAFFIIVTIIIVAVVTSLIFAQRAPPVVEFSRNIDTSDAEGRAEMMSIARDALAFPGTNIISAVDARDIKTQQQFTLCAIRGAYDTNIRLAITPAMSALFVVSFARDKITANIYAAEGRLIADRVKFAPITAQSHDDPIYSLAEIRAALPDIAPSPVSNREFKRMLIAPSHPSSLVGTPVTLTETSMNGVFRANHIWGQHIGYIVGGVLPYLIDSRDGRIITAIAGEGDIVSSIDWPSSVAIPETFCWKIQ